MLGTLTVENDTIHWLVNRQIDGDKDKGGFNGRVNKPGDTCYSFWAGGALDVLPSFVIDTDPRRNKVYLCGMESRVSSLAYSTSSPRWIRQNRGTISWYLHASQLTRSPPLLSRSGKSSTQPRSQSSPLRRSIMYHYQGKK
jgi:hypothetical protein